MLTQIIKEQIKNQGPISFCDFMDMSLYYPELGYYTSSKQKIGKRGDFYTAPSLSPIFGHLVAKQVEQMWDILGEEEFTLVEYGAGPGHLCCSILEYMTARGRIDKLRYCIIEKSAYMIAEAKKILPQHVEWIASIEELDELKGCVLSNELVDNLPVHRIAVNSGLKEIFVNDGDEFCEMQCAARESLQEYLDVLKISLPEGFRGEINLQATQWMKEVAQKLEKGFVLTIDYGYPAGELLEEHRKQGTVTCYYKHRISQSPYHYIGEQDITAHVNFSALCLWGYKHGLDYCGFTNQSNFLLALGFHDWLKKHALPGNDYRNYLTEQTLSNILLYEMGSKFKVLIQKKGVMDTPLLGLRRA